MLTLLFVLIVPTAIFAAWAEFTLSYTYSAGDRAGYVQKLSHKGWVCKTWEGELAQANLPGHDLKQGQGDFSATTMLIKNRQEACCFSLRICCSDKGTHHRHRW